MEALIVWCVGFREIRWVQPVREGREAMPARERIEIDHGLAVLEKVLAGKPRVFLPEPSGAGPCGSSAHPRYPACDPGCYTPKGAYEPAPRRDVPSPLAWSLMNLIGPLQQWYATRPVNPYPKLGAKSGGGHGRGVLW